MQSIDSIRKKYEPKKENLISIFHEIQDNNPKQFIGEEELKKVSSFLNLTMSEIYGVVTYYSMLSTIPRGKYLIRLCHSPVCDIVGSDKIATKIKELLKIDFNETTIDGMFTLEKCECLGLCGNKPSMMINKEVFTGLTESNAELIIESLKNN